MKSAESRYMFKTRATVLQNLTISGSSFIKASLAHKEIMHIIIYSFNLLFNEQYYYGL